MLPKIMFAQLIKWDKAYRVLQQLVVMDLSLLEQDKQFF